MARQFRPTGARADRVVAILEEVSRATQHSMAQVALAWLRYRDIPVIPIIGARRIAQLQDNLASLNLTLSDEQIAKLDAVSTIEMGFPRDFYERELVKNMVYGGMYDQLLAA